MPIDDPITEAVISAAIEVHSIVGPGHLESFYRNCLCAELELRQIPFEKEVRLPISYKGVVTSDYLRADVIVKQAVIIELKAVEQIIPIHKAQLKTYLKLTGITTGLLINFNVPMLRDGIRRVTPKTKLMNSIPLNTKGSHKTTPVFNNKKPPVVLLGSLTPRNLFAFKPH
jgi:GxxExxY protein